MKLFKNEYALFGMVCVLLFTFCSFNPSPKDLEGEWIVDANKAEEMMTSIEDMIGIDVDGLDESEVKDLLKKYNESSFFKFKDLGNDRIEFSMILEDNTISNGELIVLSQDKKVFTIAPTDDEDEKGSVEFIDKNHIQIREDESSGKFAIYLVRKK